MGKNYQYLLKQNLRELNPITVGEAECPPHQEIVLDMRTSSVLHYIRRGRGKLCLNGQVYDVGPGQFFLVMIGEHATCIADPDDPWEYQWIGFTGVLSHDFAQLPPVFSLPQEVVDHLYDLSVPEENLAMRVASDLFLLHSKLIKPKQSSRDYVQLVVDYVQTSYMHKISVEQMADTFGINRSYLSRLFKAQMNTSIQDYILRIRLSEAKRYLKYGYSVKETALLCGFNDSSRFTRTFTREEQLTPSDWKKTYIKKTKKDQPFRQEK